jgi:hypothetical protein
MMARFVDDGGGTRDSGCLFGKQYSESDLAVSELCYSVI